MILCGSRGGYDGTNPSYTYDNRLALSWLGCLQWLRDHHWIGEDHTKVILPGRPRDLSTPIPQHYLTLPSIAGRSIKTSHTRWHFPFYLTMRFWPVEQV